MAVGSTDSRTLAENWDGTRWIALPTVDPNSTYSSNELNSVSCLTLIGCFASGDSNDGAARDNSLFEFWNGNSWNVQASSDATLVNIPTAISCDSATSCVAAGWTYDDTGYRGAAVEVWDGTAWTQPSIPLTLGDTLAGVSCSPNGACVAVGGSGQPLIIRN
jgi:hypothetical protein